MRRERKRVRFLSKEIGLLWGSKKGEIENVGWWLRARRVMGCSVDDGKEDY